MGTQGIRRSDRISLELPIDVSGTDGVGRAFMDETHTVLLSRHGAKIVLARKLAPDQEFNVHCRKTGREGGARVVGQIGECEEGAFYGIEILDADLNLWDIDFPPLAEAERAVARVLLECGHCHAQELTYLNEFEVEVFEANCSLTRKCKRCRDAAIFKNAAVPPAEEQLPLPVRPGAAPAVAPDPPGEAVRTENERKDLRVKLNMTACVRSSSSGDDVVITEDVSPGGVRFKSGTQYAVGAVVEIALPYSRNGANVFAPAKIEHAEALPPGGVYFYGASMIHVHKGWPVK